MSWTTRPRAGRWAPERWLALLGGLYLLGTGVAALAQGRWLYADYLRLPVPAPLAVVAGVLLLAIAWRRGRAS